MENEDNGGIQEPLLTPTSYTSIKEVHFTEKGKDIEIQVDNIENGEIQTDEEKKKGLATTEEYNTNSSGEEIDNQEEEEEGSDDVDIEEIDELRNVKDRQEAINVSHPFGLRLWKPALYKKHRSIFTTTHEALHSQPGMRYTKTELYLFPGNMIWAITFGWIAAAIYIIVAIGGIGPVYISVWIYETLFCHYPAITLTPQPKQSTLLYKYIKLLLRISGYILWPFGKYIERIRGNISDDVDYYAAVHTEQMENEHYKNFISGRVDEIVGDYSRRRNDHFTQKYENNQWTPKRIIKLIFGNGFSGFIYYFWMFLIIAPMHLIVSCICWIFVVSIPMTKLNILLLSNLLNEPMELYIHSTNPPTFQFHALFQKIHHSSTTSGTGHTNGNENDESLLPLLNTNNFNSIPGSSAEEEEPSFDTSPLQSDLNNYQLSGQSEIILCTYRAIGLRYYKYTLEGVNVILFNSLLFVVFTLLDAYIISPRTDQTGIGRPEIIFFSSLISVIPLSYFIGMSVSSITAQTNLAFGAVINATFGSIIEVILYSIALNEGKSKIVEGSLIGSILCGTLALPGMSMLTGGLKRKEQRFNAKSAGVSSTLLILAIIGVFTPTLFQYFFGPYDIECDHCPENLDLPDGTFLNNTSIAFDNYSNSTLHQLSTETMMQNCKGCRFTQPEPVEDSFYKTHTTPLVWFCAIVLIFTYAVGLLFTLRTHVHQIYEKKIKNKRSRSRTPRSASRSHSKKGGSRRRHSASSRSARASSSQQDDFELRVTREDKKSNEAISNRNIRDDNDEDIIYDAKGKNINRNKENIQFKYNELVDLSGNQYNKDLSSDKKPYSVLTVNTETSSTSSPIKNTRHEMNDTLSSGSESESEGENEEKKGHEAPSWTKTKSAIVLLVCTITFSMLAEVLIASVDVVLKSINIDQKFLGITLFALAPNVSEFYNAIAFSLYGNIALSLEIGSAYAIQVAMLQIPALVCIYNIRHIFVNVPKTAAYAFTLIFNKWDVIVTVIGVFLLSHVYAEGKSNYFKGAMLLLAYLVFVISYYFISP